jgi:xylan 1,4-beta-xylosidase
MSAAVDSAAWSRTLHHRYAIVDSRDLADTYLPAFEACISPLAGGASGIMCSYNALNGIPTCADEWLLTSLARDQWDFDGYITR